MKKTDFLKKKLSSRICPNVDSDYPRGTCENAVHHFHVTIQIIITSYLRPVLCKTNIWLSSTLGPLFDMNYN